MKLTLHSVINVTSKFTFIKLHSHRILIVFVSVFDWR